MGMDIGLKKYSHGNENRTHYDVAVIMPTIGRRTLIQAVESVFAQTSVASIQLLIGFDVVAEDAFFLENFLKSPPPHVDVYTFNPGYSTSVRHGGYHLAGDGGALRTILSYLANARYLTYLDDDNWWAPDHLSSLLQAVKGKDWAFAHRWFVHPTQSELMCRDTWESVGLNAGVYGEKFGGWVDPNCYIFDKVKCEDLLGLWSKSRTITDDGYGMTADRLIFDGLRLKSQPGTTNLASVYYRIQPEDTNYKNRINKLEKVDLSKVWLPKPVVNHRLDIVITCKGRLAHLKQSLPTIAHIAGVRIILVDYDCPQNSGEWVKANFPKVDVLSISDRPYFELAKARNLGAQQLRAPWVMFMDADVLVRPGFAEWMTRKLSPGYFHINQTQPAELMGTFICQSENFRRVGGYDENFQTWGGEDVDIYHRLKEAGVHPRIIEEQLFVAIQHDDSLRFEYARGANSKPVANFENNLYMSVKYDLKAFGLDINKLNLSQQIRSKVKKYIYEFNKGNSNNTYEVILDERKDLMRFEGFKVSRKIVYSVDRRN